jgi:hypothetical protein
MASDNFAAALIVAHGIFKPDAFDVLNPDKMETVFRNRRPEVEGLPRSLKLLGANNFGPALMNFALVDVVRDTEVLRMTRKITGFSINRPFELYDGSRRLLARFSRRFTVKGEKWRFWTDDEHHLFDVTIKRKSGPFTSVKSSRFELAIGQDMLAVIEPWEGTKTTAMDGKRCTLVRIEDSPEPSGNLDGRILRYGIAMSLSRILSLRNA